MMQDQERNTQPTLLESEMESSDQKSFVKLIALEIPTSKWSYQLDSPIDSARGLRSRRNLPLILDPLSISGLVDNKPLAHPFSAPTGRSSSWPTSPPSSTSHVSPGGKVSISPNTLQNSGGILGRFKCICGSLFDSKDDFYDHHANSCVSNSNICQICSRGFARKQDLKHHMSVHTIQTVVCLDCGFKFSRPQALNRHKNHCRKV